MVLKCNLPRPRKGTPDDTYWAVGAPSATAVRKARRAGKVTYVVDTEAPTPPRRDRANRKERGLLDYEKCTILELTTFIQSRGISMPTTTLPKLSTKEILGIDESDQGLVEPNKKDCITILQKADDAAVFPRFLKLAPELRTIIYQKYHEDFDQLRTLPRQPPLSRVSKQVRAEALPIFYANSTFVLRLHENVWDNYNNGEPLAITTYNKRNDPDLLTSGALSASNLSRITRIRLRLHYTWREATEDSGSWDIDLGRKAGLLIHEGRLNCGGGSFQAVRHGRLRAAIEHVFLGIWAREGPKKFRRGDIEDLRAAVHAALASLSDW
jgi:hypothetical protein